MSSSSSPATRRWSFSDEGEHPIGLRAGAEEDRLEGLRRVGQAHERPRARARVGLGADEVHRVRGAEHQRPLAVVEPHRALGVDGAQHRAAGGEVARAHRRAIMTEGVVSFTPEDAAIPRAAAVTASAISARERTEATETNSSGWWACPPRGPRPSTVRSIVRGEVARVAGAAARARPERAAEERRGGGDQALADGGARVHPRPAPDELRLQVHAVDRRRDDPGHALERLESLAAQVADQLALGGDDVERVAGADDRGDGREPVGPGGVGARGDEPGGLAEREQRVAALLRRGARVRRDPVRADAQRGRRLALGDHGLLVAVELAGLEAQAGVVAGEARRVAEAAGPPLLVDHGEQGELREALRDRGQRAHDPERERDPALHVHRPGADQAVALAGQRTVVGVGDDGVEMAEQQHPAAPGARDRRQQIGGVPGRRAGRPLDRRLVRQHRGDERADLLRGRDVPRRGRDRDQGLELALEVGRDPLRRTPRPRLP